MGLRQEAAGLAMILGASGAAGGAAALVQEGANPTDANAWEQVHIVDTCVKAEGHGNIFADVELDSNIEPFPVRVQGNFLGHVIDEVVGPHQGMHTRSFFVSKAPLKEPMFFDFTQTEVQTHPIVNEDGKPVPPKVVPDKHIELFPQQDCGFELPPPVTMVRPPVTAPKVPESTTTSTTSAPKKPAAPAPSTPQPTLPKTGPNGLGVEQESGAGTGGVLLGVVALASLTLAGASAAEQRKQRLAEINIESDKTE